MTVKKRQRLVLVCDNCHKRKIKCDRDLPCASCKQRGIAPLCCYSKLEKELAKQGKTTKQAKSMEDTTQMELAYLRSRIRELESSAVSAVPSFNSHNEHQPPSLEFALTLKDTIGVNPVAAANETSDFFYNVRPGGFFLSLQDSFALSYPLSFISIVKREVGYRFFWKFNRASEQKDTFKFHVASGLGGLLDIQYGECSDLEDKRKDLFGQFFIPKLENTPKPYDSSLKKAISLWGAASGMTYYHNFIPASCGLFQKLTFVLPPKTIIIRYLNVFFDRIHIFFPIFNKESFMASVDKMIEDRRDDDPRIILNIEKRSDVPILISVLFSLRASYAYLIHYKALTENADFKADMEKLALLDYPIHFDVVTIAKDCLKEFNLQIKQALQILQAFLMFKIYKTMSFEDGDATRETDFCGVSLVEAACALGLNRDPDSFYYDNLDESTKNHRRKLWLVLLTFETVEQAVFGRNAIDETRHDVKMPTDYSPDKLNAASSFVENMKALMSCNKYIRSMNRAMLSLNTPINVDQLTSLLSKLETQVAVSFGTFDKLVNFVPIALEESDHYSAKIFYFLAIESYALKVYFVLHLINESKGHIQAAFFYFKKLIHTLLIELGPVYHQLLKPRETYDPMFHFLTIPIIVRYIFMFTTSCIVTTIKIGLSLKSINSADHRWNILTKLAGNFLNLFLKCQRYLGPYVAKYYSAWKASRVLMYCYFVGRDGKIFETDYHDISVNWGYTKGNFDHLNSIVETFLDAVASDLIPAERTNPELVWLQVNSYDPDQAEQDNMRLQRMHIGQIDCAWNHLVALLPDSEAIPSCFKNDNDSLANTQIANLLNVEIINGSMDILQSFGGFAPHEDFLFNDGLYGSLT